ncbi:MAG TPA: hypothetical protein VFZ91_07195 [Allosphingosinicella sp.]
MPKLSFQGGHAFDAGLAALAAVSAGFVVFAMPEPLFSGLIEASRLPEFVAAAQPPLGETARLAAAGVAALFAFAAVWALMAALDRVPARRAAPGAEPETEAPRLRRADAHPDAPAPRPLLARDLGEPLELDVIAEAPEPEPPLQADDRPLPGFLIPQASELEPDAEAEAEDETSHAETDPEPEPQAEPPPIADLAAQLPEAKDEADQSLSQLVNRIEFGLSRKRQALPAGEPPAVETPSVEEERVGHRLRSAINDLQKIASSGT